MNLKPPKTDEASQNLEQARAHLQLSCDLYKKQHEDGLYFLHEHPHDARSWSEPCIEELLQLPGTVWIRTDLCETGLTVNDQVSGQELPARKTTGWITNSPCIAEELSGFQCRNRGDGTGETHRHGQIIGGSAITRPTEEYRPALVAAILRGLRRQLQADGLGTLSSLEPGATGHDNEAVDDDDVARFYDDLTGEMLDPAQVRRARQDEIEFLNSLHSTVPKSTHSSE